MNRTFTSLRICYFGTLALTLLAVILRTVAMLCCFDATDPTTGGDLGYFRDGVLPVLCQVLCGLAVLCPLVCSLCISKQDATALKSRTQTAVVAPSPVAVIPAAVTLTASVLFVVLFIQGILHNQSWANLIESMQASGRPIEIIKNTPGDRTLLALSLLGLISALFFVARAGLKLGALITSLLACAVLAFGCVAIWDLYTDQPTTMNNAIKLSIQFGLVSLMLALTSEARALLGKYAPRSGLAFHALAVFFCFNASIPNLVAYFAETVSPNRVHFILSSFLLAVAVYETFRFVQLILAYEANEPQDTQADPVAEAAAEMTEVVSETEVKDESPVSEDIIYMESPADVSAEPETSSAGGDES